MGRAGGMQVVSLDPACLQKGKGVALHELMHVVGFWHEHSRADRDKYIKISWNNILTGESSLLIPLFWAGSTEVTEAGRGMEGALFLKFLFC